MSEGSSIAISGSGFGANDSTQEWLGSNIESGVAGADFAKSNWDMSSYGWAPVKYSTSAPHSGSKALQTTPNSQLWNGELAYHLPKAVGARGKIFVSYWVRYNGSGDGQWKMLRLSGKDTIVDGPDELNLYNWFSAGPMLEFNPASGNDQTLFADASYFPRADNQWYRVDLFVEASDVGSSNGTVKLTRYDFSTVNTLSDSSRMTHVSSGSTYGHVIFQNYVGNGISSATISMDDIYISNTQARVELCDSPSWSTRKHCELQIPRSWSGSSISATLNVGSFSTAAGGYLYVIDSTGSVNATGFKLQAGGSSPLPPNSVQVQ
jgi:hypothetical protein